ncbi:MAG: hypothetical protein M3P43_03620, partial [Actinomycetota bacterium]|nr:hypothetical protein [Actinomycetota bacterium]
PRKGLPPPRQLPDEPNAEAVGTHGRKKEDIMSVTLQDPTRPRDPSSGHAFPDAHPEPKLRAPRTLAEDLLAARAPDSGPEPVPARGVTLVQGRTVIR